MQEPALKEKKNIKKASLFVALERKELALGKVDADKLPTSAIVLERMLNCKIKDKISIGLIWMLKKP